jgi:hypothetical protein
MNIQFKNSIAYNAKSKVKEVKEVKEVYKD